MGGWLQKMISHKISISTLIMSHGMNIISKVMLDILKFLLNDVTFYQVVDISL